MSFNTFNTSAAYAILIAVWMAGFVVGYVLRSYLAYRRRTRTQRALFRIPESRGRLALVPMLEEDRATLAPRDHPIDVEQGAREEQRPATPPVSVSDGFDAQPKGHRLN
jgi:hypothetical protein